MTPSTAPLAIRRAATGTSAWLGLLLLLVPLLGVPAAGRAWAQQPAAGPAAPGAAETALWAEVRDSTRAGDLQAYLDTYPQGLYAALARRRLAALAPGAPAVGPAAAPQQAAASAPAAGPAPVTDCDRLAQPVHFHNDLFPSNISRAQALVDGVSPANLATVAARAACARAMADWPREGRFAAYAGRAAEDDGNYEEALRLFRLGAEQGNAFAQCWLELTYMGGLHGLQADEGEGLRLLRLAAAGGAPVAQLELAGRYADGTGVAKDEREAVRWFRLAAEDGHALSQVKLGMMLRDGAGVAKDEREAVRWFRLAADQNSGVGQVALGMAYEDGIGGLPRNDQEAVRLYRLAAAGNGIFTKQAQASLGIMIASGRGVARDDREAVRLFQLAVGDDFGASSAQAWLGTMHEDGRGGLAKDDAEAVRWYRKAADGDDALGQYRLGRMYSLGRGGLPRDGKETERLYRLAAAGGNADAQEAVKKLDAQRAPTLGQRTR